MEGTLEHNTTTIGIHKAQRRRMCLRQYEIDIDNLHHGPFMAYVDDLLVVGDNTATQPFLQQFQQHLELKRTTPLEFLGKTIEL
eukprot:5503222-Amphidinium_carterae.3